MDICHSNLLHVNKAQGGRDDGLDTPHRRQGEDGGWRYDRFDKNKKFLFVFIIIRIGEKIAQSFLHCRLGVVYEQHYELQCQLEHGFQHKFVGLKYGFHIYYSISSSEPYHTL